MNTHTDPQQIRAQVDQVLAEVPETPDDGVPEEVDIEAAGRRLEQAHQILVDALESVEKG